MSATLHFIEALSILSKSSPYAVATDKPDYEHDLLQQLKEYLYIKMPIEEEVKSKISALNSQNKKRFVKYS